MENPPILNKVKEETNFDIKQEEVTFELIEELNERCLSGVDEDVLNKTEEQEEESCLPDFGTQVLIKTEEEESCVSNEETEESVISNEIIDKGDRKETVKKEDGREVQSNPMEFTYVKVEWEEEQEWEESLGQEADPLDVNSPVKIKVETQLIKEEEDDKEEDMTMSDTSPSTSQDVQFPFRCADTWSKNPVNCDSLSKKMSLSCTSEECIKSGKGKILKSHLIQSKEPGSTCITSDLLGSKNVNIKIHKQDKGKVCASQSTSKKQSSEKTDKRYKCATCDYSSVKASTTTIHMRVDSRNKQYKCTVCGYCTINSGHFTVHMRVHTKEKPFKCTICDYCATTSSALIVHMRVHSGVKPYKCTECDHCASSSSNLTTHMRVHSGDKPYKCIMCDYSATKSSRLNEHMRKHSGDKPYKCTICGHCSISSSNLKMHMKRHT